MEDTARKLAVLARVARALNGAGVCWAVGGSLLLYFTGRADRFRDIDLMAREEDAGRLLAALCPMGALHPPRPDPRYRTRCFLQFTIDGVDVDVMAGMVILAGGREHDCSLRPERVTGRVLVEGEPVPLQALEDWRRYYALMGRPEKVRMIDAGPAKAE